MSAGHAEPVRFIVDESRTLAPARGVDIAALLDEGRKYGLVVRTATQRPPASP